MSTRDLATVNVVLDRHRCAINRVYDGDQLWRCIRPFGGMIFVVCLRQNV
jgi:hypothetical protein